MVEINIQTNLQKQHQPKLSIADHSQILQCQILRALVLLTSRYQNISEQGKLKTEKISLRRKSRPPILENLWDATLLEFFYNILRNLSSKQASQP